MENFQPLLSSSFCTFSCKNMAGNGCLEVEITWDNNFFNYRFLIVVSRNPKEGDQPSIVDKKKILMSEVLMHTSFSCFLEDKLLFKPHTHHLNVWMMVCMNIGLWRDRHRHVIFWKLMRSCHMHFSWHVLGCATLLQTFVLATMPMM